jgi:hypothetical protein
MNSFKTSTIAKSIAAAGFAAALASPAIAQFKASTPNLPGTPNDGMICRSGYTPNFTGTALKCSKTGEIKVALACLEVPFTTKVVRAVGSLGSAEGLDVCDKPAGITITADTDLRNLSKGNDYVFAKQDDAQIAVKAESERQAEATALGVAVNEVEVEIGTAVTDKTSGDATDKSKVPLTFYTFAIKNGGLSGPVGLPATGNSTSAFVPKALPR